MRMVVGCGAMLKSVDMGRRSYAAAIKRMRLRKLNERLSKVVSEGINEGGGILSTPKVLAISRKMDVLVVEIMELEAVV